MARTEADKEDLIADATAMVPRAEYVSVNETDPAVHWEFVTVGVRRNGAVSVYLDQDPFYQFDAAGGLRRAYVDGFLFRSSGDGLTQLNRTRSQNRTTLEAAELSSRQLVDFRQRMFNELSALRDAWISHSIRKNRSVPDDADPSADLCDFIARMLLRDPSEFLSAPVSPR